MKVVRRLSRAGSRSGKANRAASIDVAALNRGFDELDEHEFSDIGVLPTSSNLAVPPPASPRSPGDVNAWGERRPDPKELAAIKVQATVRGHRARKKLSLIAESPLAPSTDAPLPAAAALWSLPAPRADTPAEERRMGHLVPPEPPPDAGRGPALNQGGLAGIFGGDDLFSCCAARHR